MYISDDENRDNFIERLAAAKKFRLGYSDTELSKKYGVSQPSVNISIKHGERIAQSVELKLVEV